MCVEWVNDWEIAPQNMTAYKIVRRDGKRYVSPTSLGQRADQGYGRFGAVLDYKIGTKVTSDEPGIYCISSPLKLAEEEMHVLEVIIPKGTKFRRGRASVPDENGQYFEMRTLNALAVRIKKVFRGKIDKQFRWPIYQKATAYTWTYVTASSTTSNSITYVTT